MIEKVQGIVEAQRKGINHRYWVVLIRNKLPEEIIF